MLQPTNMITPGRCNSFNLAMKRKRFHSLNTPEKLAKKFHNRADKSGVLQRFVLKARMCSKRQARRYAFHIASWFACAPLYYIPGSMEMDLLHKFVLKLGGGQLPGRLRKVLPKAQAALEGMNLRGRIQNGAWQRLRQRLQRFHCCRNALAEGHPGSEAEDDAEQEQDKSERQGMESEENEDKKEDKVGGVCHAEAGRNDTAIVEVDSCEDQAEADIHGYYGSADRD